MHIRTLLVASLIGPAVLLSPHAGAAGLGTTAPSNFHHWVGYVTVGFTAGEAVR